MKKLLMIIVMMAIGIFAIAQDRIDLNPGYARIKYDATEQYFGEGWYKMKLIFQPSGTEYLPQTQVILYVSDTMAIAKTDTRIMAVDYLHDAYNFFGVTVDTLALKFVDYNYEYDRPYPHYQVYIGGTLNEPDQTPFTLSYDFLMDFFDRNGNRYTPTGETPETEGLRILSSAPASKVLRNGQVLILRDGRTYDLTGRPVKL